MARVEIPAPGDLIMDEDGNVRQNATVSLKLAGTGTDVTHYSALTGGTSTTGGLKSGSDGTVVDGAGNRRYVDDALAMDLTILGRTRQIEPVSAAAVAVMKEAPLNAKNPPAGTAAVVWDGTTDDTTALTAIAALLPQTGSTNQRGGEIILPRGAGVIHGLNLDGTYNACLKGHSGRYGGTTLLTNSTAATAMISAKSSGGLRIEDLALESTSSSFTGKMLDLDKGSGIDTALFHLKNLRVNMISQASSAVIGVSLENAISGVIEACYFIGGKAGVRGRTGAGSYSNAIQILGECYFQNQDVAAILNPWFNWTVDGNTFEPLRGGAAGAVLNEASIPAHGLFYEHNWHGDATNFGTGIWVATHGDTISIERNTFDSGLTAVKVMAATSMLSMGGNYINGVTNGLDFNSVALTGGCLLPNKWGTVTNRYVNFSALGTPAVWIDDTMRVYKSGTVLALGQGLTFDTDAAIFQQQQASTTSFTHRARIATDTQDRYQLAANGIITRGPGGSTAPTITFEQGAGAPSSTPGNGSLYQRTDGAGTTDNLYIRRSGAWVGIA